MPFIVLEGLDGAGKSTQLEKLTEYVARQGVEHKYLHFPRYDSPIYGELIARFLRGEFGENDKVDPYLVALLFAGDRVQAAPMMKQWLNEGKVVITDRFVYSNIAFQGAKVKDAQEVEKLSEWIFNLEFKHNALPRPDVSLFLDVPHEFIRENLTVERKGEDRDYLMGAKDIHEQSLEFQTRVRDIYLTCAEKDDRFKVVDCSDGHGKMDSPDNIFAKIKSFVKPLL